MKKTLCILVAALALAGCKGPQEPKVMARFVPERADDFIWENDYVIYRAYGETLEHDIDFLTSPGFDIWVKHPGTLVADRLYKDELENGLSYHNDRGLGKDCYKVSKTLGGGASSIVVADSLRFPATNYRSWEILEQTPEKVVFVLHYPQWEAAGYEVSLDKKITVEAGTHFCKAEDTYTFRGPEERLFVAAGIIRHDIVAEISEDDRFAIWEHASDQSKEPEDGMIGLGLVMPDADGAALMEGHSVLCKEIASGETVTYWFGNCWSKGGDIATAQEWFDLVEKQ